MFTRRGFIALGGLVVPSSVWAAQQALTRGVTSTGSDPVLQSLANELVEIHQQRQHGRRGGEHFRRAAGVLSVLNSYGATIRLDDQLKRAVKNGVEVNGMNTLVQTLQPHRDVVVAELKAKGYDFSDLPEFQTLDPTFIQATVDKVISQGVTPTFDRVRRAFVQVAPQLDKLSQFDDGTGARLRQAQDAGDCYAAWHILIEEATVTAELTCVFAPELCVAAWAIVALLYAEMFTVCWFGWG